MRGGRSLLALLALAVGASEAGAHARSTSTSTWDLEPDGSARVVVRVRWEDLQRALPELEGVPPVALGPRADLAQPIDDYLLSHHRLTAGGVACAPSQPPAPVASLDPSHVGRSWRVRCPRPASLRLEIDGFLEVAPGHLHLARVRSPGSPAIERAFVSGSSAYALEPAAAARTATGSGLADYLRLGIEHIATGADHLVFLLALLFWDPRSPRSPRS